MEIRLVETSTPDSAVLETFGFSQGLFPTSAVNLDF